MTKTPLTTSAAGPPGALVISLDFELAWGVFDSVDSDGSYRNHLLGAREAVPRILDLFMEHGIAATWATVGLLFAESRDEAEAFFPVERPRYANPRLDPYRVQVGRGEHDDPTHYAPTLIRAVASAPRQEIGSHTFSHYYCLEPGQTADAFEADLQAARAIAEAKGHALESLVVPRHQVRQDYLPAVARAGFRVHRTNEANRLSRPRAKGRDLLALRAVRLLDSYLPLTGANLVPWSAAEPDQNDLVDVRESRFVRPMLRQLRAFEPVRVQRVVGAMTAAARRSAICHLWWHPHNFGVHLEEQLASLRAILGTYLQLRDEHGMASLSMRDVADAVRRRGGALTHNPEPGA